MENRKKIDDGGHAYPVCFEGGKNSGETPYFHEGMSLRDWFAGKVLASVDWSERDISSFSDDDLQQMAGQVYRISDAMIAARKAGA